MSKFPIEYLIKSSDSTVGALGAVAKELQPPGAAPPVADDADYRVKHALLSARSEDQVVREMCGSSAPAIHNKYPRSTLKIIYGL